MEQHIYTSAVIRRQTGFQTVAKSAGMDEEMTLELENLYGFFGNRPADIPADGIFSFAKIRDRWITWKLYDNGLDPYGRPGNIWIHAFVLNESELAQIENDPFELEQAGLFHTPPESIESILFEELPQIAPPEVKSHPVDLAGLKSLSNRQKEFFLSSVLCKGECHLFSDVIGPDQIRSVLSILPIRDRKRTTFYGLVTGVPYVKASLAVFPLECFRNSVNRSADTVVCVETEQMQGTPPNAYARRVLDWIEENRVGDIKDLNRFLDRLGLTAIGDEGDSSVKMWDEQQQCIQDLNIKGFLSVCSQLQKRGQNAIEANDILDTGLIEIARQAIRKEEWDHSIDALTVLSKRKLTDHSPVYEKLSELVAGLWKKVHKEPKLVPKLLGLPGVLQDIAGKELDRLLDCFDIFKKDLDGKWSEFQTRKKLWQKIIKSSPKSDTGRKLADHSSLAILLDALEMLPENKAFFEWKKYKRRISQSDFAELLVKFVSRLDIQRRFVGASFMRYFWVTPGSGTNVLEKWWSDFSPRNRKETRRFFELMRENSRWMATWSRKEKRKLERLIKDCAEEHEDQGTIDKIHCLENKRKRVKKIARRTILCMLAGCFLGLMWHLGFISSSYKWCIGAFEKWRNEETGDNKLTKGESSLFSESNPDIPGFTFLKNEIINTENDQRTVKVYLHKATDLEFVLLNGKRPDIESVGEDERDKESPSRPVEENPFLMCRTACTRSAFEKNKISPEVPVQGEHDPVLVTEVSWKEAEAWCRDAGLRLPTWEEWEFACSTGKNWPIEQIEEGKVEERLKLYLQDGKRIPTVKQPQNTLGLYYMIYGVFEWCADIRQERVESGKGVAPFSEDQKSALRIFCGGIPEEDERPPFLLRGKKDENAKETWLGFRPAKSID